MVRLGKARRLRISRHVVVWTCLIGTLFASNWSAAPAQTDGDLPSIDDTVPDLREPLGKWEETAAPRWNHDYTLQRLLPSGNVFRYSRNDVLQECSEESSPEIYNTRNGTWTEGSAPNIVNSHPATGSCQKAQVQSAAVLTGNSGQCAGDCDKLLIHFKVCFTGQPNSDLNDGRVWRIYDANRDLEPGGGTAWSDATAKSQPLARSSSSSLLLSTNCGNMCGEVLVIGAGRDCHHGDESQKVPELYRPSDGSWRPIDGNNHTYAELHPPMLVGLPDGKALAVGCQQGDPPQPWSEILDPSAPDSQWRRTAGNSPAQCSEGMEASGSSAVVFPSGHVLVTALDANTGDPASQMFEPGNESWMAVPEACCGQTVVLPNGKALIVKPKGRSIIWDPKHPSTSLPAAKSPIGSSGRATALSGGDCGRNCGKVLVTGPDEQGLIPDEQKLAAALYTPAPDLISLGPAEGPVTGGTRVEVNGYSFIGDESAISVEFGGVRGQDLEILSDTKLRVTAPGGAAVGAVPVRVITPAGKTPDSEVSRFSYLPAITALRPDRVKMQGGVEVSILGKGLSKTESVRFGAVDAKSFRIASDNEVVAVAPSHSRPEVVPVSLMAAGLRSVPASAGTNLLTYFADDPLGRLDDDIDDTVSNVTSQGSAGGGTRTPLSAIVPTQGSSFSSSLGSGPPSVPTPAPSGPLAAPATIDAPQAAVRALAANPPFLQPSSASALSQSIDMGAGAGIVVGQEGNSESEPGIRYAMIALSAMGLALLMGAGVLDPAHHRCGLRPSDYGPGSGPKPRRRHEPSFQTAY